MARVTICHGKKHSRSRITQGVVDTYIVRIYRNVTRDVEEPAGTIEHVESGERVAFSDARGLLARLITRRRRRDAEDTNEDRADN